MIGLDHAKCDTLHEEVLWFPTTPFVGLDSMAVMHKYTFNGNEDSQGREYRYQERYRVVSIGP